MEKTLSLFTLILIIIPSFFLPMLINAHASDEVISMQILEMQNAEKLLARLKKSIAQGDFKQVEKEALNLQGFANKMLTYFPAGSAASVNNSSAASNEIWEKSTLFEKLVKTNRFSVKKMVLASRKSDKDKPVEALKATKKVCDACHEKFRNELFFWCRKLEVLA